MTDHQTTDPVREALRQAAIAIRQTPGHAPEMAAAAVAAFLRARERQMDEEGSMHSAGWYALEADAVEAERDAS